MGRIEDNGEILTRNFTQLGLPVKLVRASENAMGEIYLFDLLNINQYNKTAIKSRIEKIAVFNHINASMIDSNEAHFGLQIRYPKQFLSLLQCITEENGRNVVVGKDMLGNNVLIDFDKTPHLLIAGTTGSGKSTLLENLVINLFAHYGGENRFKKMRMVVIDTKNGNLRHLTAISNCDFTCEVNEAISILKNVELEMNSRYEKNHYDYDIYLIIDELADLMLTSRFEVEKTLVRLASLGRGCGIHLIVATQNPKVEVCTGLIKANFPYRICLKTASMRESCVVLDNKGAEELDIGEAIFKNGNKQTHFKIACPESNYLAQIIEINRG